MNKLVPCSWLLSGSLRLQLSLIIESRSFLQDYSNLYKISTEILQKYSPEFQGYCNCDAESQTTVRTMQICLINLV